MKRRYSLSGYNMPDQQDIEIIKGLRLYGLVPALIDCTPGLFQQNPTDIRAALSIISDASEILPSFLKVDIAQLPGG